MSTVTPVTLAQLTDKTVGGVGAFDVLMTAVTAHLEREYTGQRLKGQEYGNVYANSLQQVLQTALGFLLQKDDAYQKALLTEAQVAVAQEQVKLAVLQQQLLVKQIEREEFDKQLVVAQTHKVDQDTANGVLEGLNLTATGCLLKAQYDLAMQNILQTTAQTTLIQQKVATEKAQTTAGFADADSVTGRQMLLYKAQTDGFTRDAEQKAAKTLIDTWNVRRTTDDATVADGINMLNDATIGRAVTKLLTGIGA